MKAFSFLMAAVLSVGLTLGTGDAEAKRLGGAKPLGMQRQATPPAQSPTVAPPATTAPAAAASTAKAPGAAAAPAPSRPSWMGPVAGLAAGLGLAALASHFGFGEELASMLMIGLLVMAVMVVIGLVMRKRAMAQQPALAGAGGGGMQYARTSFERSEPAAQPHGEVVMGGASMGAAAVQPNIPADFDVEGFVRNAKVHFIRLQAANDAGNLEDIRAFSTPEMFAELKMDIVERSATAQTTDVVKIDADVIEVAEEAGRYVVSVRFNGLIREDANGPVEAFEEVWNLVKPVDGTGGWLLAGIQQMH